MEPVKLTTDPQPAPPEDAEKLDVDVSQAPEQPAGDTEVESENSEVPTGKVARIGIRPGVDGKFALVALDENWQELERRDGHPTARLAYKEALRIWPNLPIDRM